MDNRDLIKQYVDTGIPIPEYQFNQLSGADKKTYLRKRLIAQNVGDVNLDVYEFKAMNDEEQKSYIRKHNLNGILFSNASDEIRDFYLDHVISKGEIFNSDWYFYLKQPSRLKYLRALATKKWAPSYFLGELSPEELEYYNKIKNEQ
jgi:hypothetical protein